MCGITGIRRFDGAPIDVALVREMASRLVHRGPDDHGTWLGDGIAFGHQRLSIIDLGGSRQPMVAPDDASALCFNGEILNYREVRSHLDFPFRTNGDTEVVVATMATAGVGGLSRLRGQFAFAWFDAGTGDLILVRDRLGILPLVYYQGDGWVAFASEAKALDPCLPSGLEVDTASLDDYLAHRSVPAPHTMYRGVHKVPPGHAVRFRADGTVSVERYWRLPDPGEVLGVSPEHAVDLVERAVRQAVEEALVADVPVGAYLSGGVDSSLISAVAAELRGEEGLQTFSAGFVDTTDDELPYARLVSSQLGTKHHEVLLGPDDFVEDWRRLSWHRDAPLSEPADVAVFRLARAARQEVKVILSGEGSDELFAGYPKFRLARVTHHLGKLPMPVRTAAAAAGDRVLPASQVRPRILLRTLAGSSEYERLRGWFAPFTEAERRELLLVPGRDERLAVEHRGDPIRRLLELDLAAWLPDNLLERGDRMSMAASLELRPPFLDHRLVELAFRLPSSVKVRDGQAKWVLKQVALRYLPPEVVLRKKVGFRVPLDRWLAGSFGQYARDLLLDPGSFVSSVLDRRAVAALVDGHLAGEGRDEIRLWTLMSLELWHEQLRESHRARVTSAP